MKLINRDLLIEHLTSLEISIPLFTMADIKKLVEEEYIIEERKCAYWEWAFEGDRVTDHCVTGFYIEGWRCSECHCFLSDLLEDFSNDHKEKPSLKFCPNCGSEIIYKKESNKPDNKSDILEQKINNGEKLVLEIINEYENKLLKSKSYDKNRKEKYAVLYGMNLVAVKNGEVEYEDAMYSMAKFMLQDMGII